MPGQVEGAVGTDGAEGAKGDVGTVGGVDLRLLRRDVGAAGLFGFETLEATRDRVVLRMPATPAHRAPVWSTNGLCALLTEESASFGAALNAPRGWGVVGIELGTSMVRRSKTTTITAAATPRGRYADYQVWEVRVTDDAGAEICAAHCTVAMRRGEV